MTAVTFKYVEEYLEFIAGYRDITGKQLGMFDTVPAPISLARYDVAVVDSLASQTAESKKAYTDKQAALAVRIVDKYRRQLSNLKIPVAVPEQLVDFKLGIRAVDRSKSVYLYNNSVIIMRFPYDTKLIDLVKSSRKDSQGSVEFDNENKVWKLALTEYAINWAVAIGKANDFTISDEVIALYDRILAVEEQGHKIELVKTDTGFAITNLVDYINDKLGGFGADNIVALLDNAEVLGYEVDPELYSQLPMDVDEKTAVLLSKRYHRFARQEEVTADDVVAYARKVNRLPVYVYESGVPKPSTEEIVYLNNSRAIDIDIKPKILLSNSSLMLGSKKQAWQVNAEKIIIIE